MLEKERQNHIFHQVEGAGPPVLFVHGVAGSMDNWAKNIPEIASAGFRTYAVDLIGHGESAKPDEPEAYHVEEVYQHLEAWIEESEIEGPFDLVGHSMGAYLVMKYALKNPEQVAKLVLVDPLYKPDQLTSVMRIWGSRPDVGVRMMKVTPENMLRPVVQWLNGFNHHTTGRRLHMLANDLHRMHPNILYTPASVDDLSDKVFALEMPTLVVWGKNDRTLAPKSFAPLVEKLPNSESMMMSFCGHTPHISKSTAFNQRVIEFLKH